MINSRSKGARGERELCDWLYKRFNIDTKPLRNLEQVRSGGADIHLPPFVFEVKRVEKLALQKWWLQVKKACKACDMPVVAFRQNGLDWEFLLPASLIGLPYGFIRLKSREFEAWLEIFLGSRK